MSRSKRSSRTSFRTCAAATISPPRCTCRAGAVLVPPAGLVGGRAAGGRARAGLRRRGDPAGSEPQVYAESILKTCEFYVESPLACVSGVTGSDLKQRIEAIMSDDARRALSGWGMSLLATAGAAVVAVPVGVGA